VNQSRRIQRGGFAHAVALLARNAAQFIVGLRKQALGKFRGFHEVRQLPCSGWCRAD
jgi:hypothetical protein